LSFHLFEPDEGRYAEIPREMLQRGDCVVPYLQGEPYLDKPPLLYWLVMLSYSVFGVHDWSARLVPALAVHGCVLLTYLLGRRSLGERAAFRGALALSLAPAFIGVGRLLVLDGLLALWVTLMLFSVLEALRAPSLRWRWWLLAATACSLGVLTKGPVAIALLLPPLWAHRRLTGRGPRIGRAAWLTLAAVVLAVTLPWYVAGCLRMPGFARHFLWEHNVVRFLSPFDHQQPVWYYGPLLLIGLLPATLLLIPFLRFLLSGDPAVAARRCPELGFLLLAGGWCVLFFSLSGCKLPTYILPALPPLALALGYFVTVSRWDRSPWPARLAGLAVVLTALSHYVLVPWYAWYRSPMGRPDEVLRFCADRQTPVLCFPRNCDSVAFYLGRDDLRSFRSKEIDAVRQALQERPRSVVLCGHRSTLEGLRHALPGDLRVTQVRHFSLPPFPGLPEELAQRFIQWTGRTPLGLCDLAVVESQPPSPSAPSRHLRERRNALQTNSVPGKGP
jgi:4-amino-4-deoxy-L-arabinose transferase-like glycosyltransferase